MCGGIALKPVIRQFGIPLAAVFIAAASVFPTPAAAASPTHWRIAVGAQTGNQAVQADAFFAQDITVDVGDTITWRVPSGEPHTVTFLSGAQAPQPVVIGPHGPELNPAWSEQSGGSVYDGTGLLSSGELNQGQSYTLQFSQAGDFSYLCLIHHNMVGSVHVAPQGTAYPKKQYEYDAAAATERGSLLGQGLILEADGLRQALHAAGNQVTTGTGVEVPGTGNVFVARFEPAQKVVKVGQTVTWTDKDPSVPHTVTFGDEPPGGLLALLAPAGAIDGPGHATLTAPGQAAHSGLIGVGQPLGTSFSVTFSAPGTYSYTCALHDTLGMKGTIKVVP
jgi:plastocyanin